MADPLLGGKAPAPKLSMVPVVLLTVPVWNKGKSLVRIEAKLEKSSIFWATSGANPKSRAALIKPAASVRISPNLISTKKLSPKMASLDSITSPYEPLLS